MIHLTHLDQIRSVVVDIRQSETEGNRGSESVTVIVPGQDGEIPQLAATSTLIPVQRLKQRHTRSTVGTCRSPSASVRLGRLPPVRLGWSPRAGQTGMVIPHQTGMVTAVRLGRSPPVRLPTRHRSDWTVDSGQWTVDSGQWTVDSGQWTVDSGQWTVDSGQWTLGHGEVTCKTLTVSAGTDRLFRTSTTLECRTGQIKLPPSALAETAYPSSCNENQYPFSVQFRIGRTDSRSVVLWSGIGTLTEPFHPSLGGVYWRLLTQPHLSGRLCPPSDHLCGQPCVLCVYSYVHRCVCCSD